jgi:hypothetical protein
MATNAPVLRLANDCPAYSSHGAELKVNIRRSKANTLESVNFVMTRLDAISTFAGAGCFFPGIVKSIEYLVFRVNSTNETSQNGLEWRANNCLQDIFRTTMGLCAWLQTPRLQLGINN